MQFIPSRDLQELEGERYFCLDLLPSVKTIYQDVALPLLYSHVRISNIHRLAKFSDQLCTSEKKWDSIRRIPYSTPGRWVQALDLSNVAFTSRTEALALDSLLTSLFPLMPFLNRFALNPSHLLSRRAIEALALRKEPKFLRILAGISYVPGLLPIAEEDPLVRLIRSCSQLEELEVIGQGLDPTEIEFSADAELDLSPPEANFEPLAFPNLHTLTLLSMHNNPLLIALLHSPLPALRKLTLTPYDDVPYPVSLSSTFLLTHGASLRSLLLFTPKSWPTRRHSSPAVLLETCPALRHISLEDPLPTLTLPQDSHHSLQIISIPRPNAEFWKTLDQLLPRLSSLRAVRTRDVRWLRQGMTSRALEAGVQGEMREWRRRLVRKGIRLLDADWKESQ